MPVIADPLVRVARRAMATRFEVVLHGAAPERLRAAAEEALDEIDRVENLLSAYRAHSDLTRLNEQAGRGWVRVDPRLFAFLDRVLALAAATDGAFDPTVGPLLRVWSEAGSRGEWPKAVEVKAAHAQTGWRHVELDRGTGCVRFHRPGMRLDPGAVGKGYALDLAVEVLREAGVKSALIHGGTSTICGLGRDPEDEPWRVVLPDPPAGFGWRWPDSRAPVIEVSHRSLSVSAVWGRTWVAGTRAYGHVLDPRSGEPVTGTWLAALSLTDAWAGDAWSTALLVLGREGLARLREQYPAAEAWLVSATGEVVSGGG
jgi:thiamine biosynthesis lipoprotein